MNHISINQKQEIYLVFVYNKLDNENAFKNEIEKYTRKNKKRKEEDKKYSRKSQEINMDKEKEKNSDIFIISNKKWEVY